MKLNFPETNGGWKKYDGNPVLGNEKLGTCFDVLVLKDGKDYVIGQNRGSAWNPTRNAAGWMT